MNVPREKLLARAEHWASMAEDDLRLARHAMSLVPPPCHLAAYHAQQAVEKYLKAFLVAKDTAFPFTHDLSILREQCASLAEWPSQIGEVSQLTVYAVSTRYPSAEEPVTVEEPCQAIDLAQRNCAIVHLAPEEEGVSFS